jgi:SpoVK/Ycf46/Vps4 family AAA+-type ATPase/alkylhydroperoxidase family enzyme
MRALRDAMRGKGKFEEMGIGGMDDMLNNVFQRAFASRMLPPEAVDKLNLQHTKGMLLHGPPGTGKTLCARQIGYLLGARTPTHINGPEVFSSLVGESEEKIRNIFKASQREWRMQGNKSPLHVIIFDEIDAVCKRRDAATSSGRSRVHDNVVNQLLTQIDGLNRQNNLLVIGVTNRRDLLDEALLRPGRLEIHLEVGLPDEMGRLQILQIHTRDLYSSQMIDEEGVDLQALAKMTIGFTGAEIEGLVRMAVAFSLGEQQEALGQAQVDTLVDEEGAESDDLQQFLEHQMAAKVKMHHFEKAITQVERPAALGGAHGALKRPDGLYPEIQRTAQEYTAAVSNVEDILHAAHRQAQKKAAPSVHSMLLTGKQGSGRTTMLSSVADGVPFEFVRVVHPRSLLGKSEELAAEYLVEAFLDAHRSPFSLLVLDELELLLDMGGKRMLTTLHSLLRSPPPEQSHSQLVVVGVLDNNFGGLLQDLSRSFEGTVNVPNLNSTEAEAYVSSGSDWSAPADLAFSNATFSQLQNLLSVAHEKVKPGEDFSSATASLKGVFMASDFGSPGSALAVADMDDWNDDEKIERLRHRFKGPNVDDMDGEQRDVYDEIMETRTTGVRGPFGPWLANVSIAKPAQELGRVCRYETSFTLQESELVILLTARHYRSRTEWDIHVEEARKAGLDERIISSIETREEPKFLLGEEKLAALFEFTSELLADSNVTEETYNRLKHAFDGEDKVVVEAVSISGYYGYVAHTLNVFGISSK